MRTKLVMSVAILCLLASMISLTAEAGQAQCPVTMKPILKNTEYYEVLRANAIKPRPGVTFEIVQTAQGKSVLRFNYQQELAAVTDAVVAQPVCGCSYPTVCTINTCGWRQNGDQILCLGGCYRADGTACVSCVASLQEPQTSE